MAGTFVHGQNLLQKENHETKYNDPKCKRYLQEIRAKYEQWKAANLALLGPTRERTAEDDATIVKRVELFSSYKDFIDQQKYAEAFDSRSNLHSSVLEEFVYYLFRDLVSDAGGAATVGKAATFKDVFFAPPSYAEMVRDPFARIEKKDHDFVIGTNVTLDIRCTGSDNHQEEQVQLPAVAIECKTYLDKAMLEGSSTAAEQIKIRTPNAIYVIVMEWLKLTEDVNLRKYKVDQIYVLRKQKNTDREFRYLPEYEKKPISTEVVIHLYETVRKHLTEPWVGGVKHGLDRGYLL
jgi:hypothetical protein